jgi:cyclic pyranopterin phosphate synthase
MDVEDEFCLNRGPLPMLIDRYQRTIDYLRISVTDRCNFRCVYCMPADGVAWKSHEEILTYEEITEFTRVAASLGIRRVRITGGEPLVRRNLASLVHSIAAIPEIDDIALTTNATLLEAQAYGLADAGLKRVNVSLDTLDAEKFARITRGGTLDQVWRGIQAAEGAGLAPIKVNAVVVRGVNDNELLDLARLTLDHAWQVRFIEFMPVANGQDWGEGFPIAGERYLSIAEMRKVLEPLQLEPSNDAKGNGPARIYHVPGGKGSIGFTHKREFAHDPIEKQDPPNHQADFFVIEEWLHTSPL